MAGVTNTQFIYTTPEGAIPDGYDDDLYRRMSDEWGKFDIPLQGLNSFTLQDGQNAAFKIESNVGDSLWSDIMIDNIAISVIPEPGSMLLTAFGMITLFGFRRLRRKG